MLILKSPFQFWLGVLQIETETALTASSNNRSSSSGRDGTDSSTTAVEGGGGKEALAACPCQKETQDSEVQV